MSLLEVSELLLELLPVGLRVSFDEILQLGQVVGQLVVLPFSHSLYFSVTPHWKRPDSSQYYQILITLDR